MIFVERIVKRGSGSRSDPGMRGEGEGETEGKVERQEPPGGGGGGGASSRGKAGGIGGRRGRQRGLEAGGRDPRGELTFAQQSSRSGSMRSHKSLH